MFLTMALAFVTILSSAQFMVVTTLDQPADSASWGMSNITDNMGIGYQFNDKMTIGVVKNGDVVYTKSPLKSNPYGIIKTNKGNPGVVSTLYAVYRPLKNTHSDFIQTYFEQDARMNNYMSPPWQTVLEKAIKR